MQPALHRCEASLMQSFSYGGLLKGFASLETKDMICSYIVMEYAHMGDLNDYLEDWDPSFTLENTKSPHPENPGKLLKNTIWPTPDCPEKHLTFTQKIAKVQIFSVLFVIFCKFRKFSGQFRGGPRPNF